MSRLAAACIGVLGWLGCSRVAQGPVTPPRPTVRAIDYELAFDPQLRSLDIRGCVRGGRPSTLVIDESTGIAAIAPDGHRVPGPVTLAAGSTCFRYTVDLDVVASESRMGSRVGNAVVLPTPSFLVVPGPREWAEEGTMVVHAPSGLDASLPWPRDGHGVAHLDPRGFRFEAYAAFGELTREGFDAHGTRVEVALLDPARAPSRQVARRWLSEAIRATTTLDGAPILQFVQFQLVPAWTGGSAVRFGITGHGGPGSITLFVSQGATERDLVGNWVAVHELSHLFVPLIDRRDSWLSEGLSSYYQEILRARAGLTTPQDAFANFDDGAARAAARDNGHSLDEDTRDLAETHEFERIYWGGAAIAMEADLELRRTIGRGLDSILAEYGRAHGADPRLMSAAELVRALDTVAGRPILTNIVAARLHARELPDLRRFWPALGVHVEGTHVTFDDSAPDAALRRALVTAPTAPHAR